MHCDRPSRIEATAVMLGARLLIPFQLHCDALVSSISLPVASAFVQGMFPAVPPGASSFAILCEDAAKVPLFAGSFQAMVDSASTSAHLINLGALSVVAPARRTRTGFLGRTDPCLHASIHLRCAAFPSDICFILFQQPISDGRFAFACLPTSGIIVLFYCCSCRHIPYRSRPGSNAPCERQRHPRSCCRLCDPCGHHGAG